MDPIYIEDRPFCQAVSHGPTWTEASPEVPSGPPSACFGWCTMMEARQRVRKRVSRWILGDLLEPFFRGKSIGFFQGKSMGKAYRIAGKCGKCHELS